MYLALFYRLITWYVVTYLIVGFVVEALFVQEHQVANVQENEHNRHSGLESNVSGYDESKG